MMGLSITTATAVVLDKRRLRSARHEPAQPPAHRDGVFRRWLEHRYSGNILADWKAPAGDIWTVPLGVGLGKVVKLGRLPIKFQLSLQYMPVRPRNTGQEWDVQVQITPVIPNLIKGILLE